MGRRMAMLVAVGALLSFSRVATAAMWYVDASTAEPGDGTSWQTAFQGIEEGVRAAGDGDTVVVGPGTYVEDISVAGKSVVIRSTNPTDPEVVASTIIAPDHFGPVVALSGVGNDIYTISGFTIRGGRAANGAGICAGDRDHKALAIIENNIITENVASTEGGGIAYCSGIIRNNTIVGNSARFGGGLARCGPIIEGNTISGNSAEEGGGLYWCSGRIQKNTITDNTATHSGGGLNDCSNYILENVVSGNAAVKYGGGFFSCDGLLMNNTIRRNGADDGGGLYLCEYSIVGNIVIGNSGGGIRGCGGKVQSNLVHGNTADSQSGGISGCGGEVLNNTVVGNSGFGLYDCQGVIANCIVWGNEEGQLFESSVPSFSCIQAWEGGGEENSAEDPRFADPDGADNDPDTYEDNNYRLASDSPCIDAGDSSVLDERKLDADSNLRIARGNTSLTVDMGAYEYGSVPFEVTGLRVHQSIVLEITWNSQPNDMYTVWSFTDLRTYGGWDMEAILRSQGETTSWFHTTLAGDLKYYRVQMR